MLIPFIDSKLHKRCPRAAAVDPFLGLGGGGGQMLEKMPQKKNRRAQRAKSQDQTLRAKRAANMKIVYV